MVTVTFPDGEHDPIALEERPVALGVLLSIIGDALDYHSCRGEINDTGGYVQADEDAPAVRFELT